MSVKITTKKRGGTFKSIKEASRTTGIPYMTLYMRVKKLGWGITKAVNHEVRKYERKQVDQPVNDNQVTA